MKKSLPPNLPDQPSDKSLNRRDFFKQSAAIGVGGTVALTGTGAAFADEGERWDYEADVVVAGAGCAGLTAALRAIELGSSVLVVDQNFDVGGRMLHSGAYVSLGGGDAVQQRDAAGLSDSEGFISVPRREPLAALDDNVDLLFVDQTDW